MSKCDRCGAEGRDLQSLHLHVDPGPALVPAGRHTLSDRGLYCTDCEQALVGEVSRAYSAWLKGRLIFRHPGRHFMAPDPQQASRADRLMAQIAELEAENERLRDKAALWQDEVAFWQRNYETASEAAKFNRDDANQQKRLRNYWEQQVKIEQQRSASAPPGWVPACGTEVMVELFPGSWHRGRAVAQAAVGDQVAVKEVQTGRHYWVELKNTQPVTDDGGGP